MTVGGRLTRSVLASLETARLRVETARAAYCTTRTLGAYWEVEAAERDLGRLLAAYAEPLIEAARGPRPCRTTTRRTP